MTFCFACQTKTRRVLRLRAAAVENLNAAADKMSLQYIRNLGNAKVGDTVQVELSLKFDRWPLDCNYLLAYIIEINEERSLYKLCTTKGYIKGLLFVFVNKTLKFASLNLTQELSLKAISDLESLSGGQGACKSLKMS